MAVYFMTRKVVCISLLLLFFAGLLVFFSMPSGCVTKQQPAPMHPPQELVSWSEFLYDQSDDEQLQKAAAFLLEVKGIHILYERVDTLSDPNLSAILRENPHPNRFVFRPSEIGLSDMRNITDRFDSVASYRNFMSEFTTHLNEIQNGLDGLPANPLFPELFEAFSERRSREFSVSSRGPHNERVFLRQDYVYYEHMVWFTEIFRESAGSSRWDFYRNHFRTSRRGSPISVIEHIQSLDDVESYRFSGSHPERKLAALLTYIRDEFPPAED